MARHRQDPVRPGGWLQQADSIMKRLYIDTETFSPEDLKTAGAYRYIESPGFDLLLISYAFDDGPVRVVDVISGEPIPQELLDALTDPRIEKWAHNAVFERLVFNAIGRPIPIEQLHCSLVKAAYCSLPLSLGQLSEVLGLEELGKKATGKALIKYFCNPCKPTKANGMRSRNMPWDDPKKWQEFKVYSEYDIHSERAVVKAVDAFEFPGSERMAYLTDQAINDRGVLMDLRMAENAIRFNDLFSEELFTKMQELTGLSNPNSVAQLKAWLSARGLEFPALGKPEILDYLNSESTIDPVVEQVLRGRLMLAKSSVKKYTAMLNCASFDNRAHGLFQFYGANRTGRWVSRLIQLQNLPQNHMPDLDTARSLVSAGDWEAMEAFYPNTPEVLSELIRTTFIAPEGMTFAVADFSAIEARVLSWIAQEKWRLEVFNTHGKIYEASASMMFGVPIEQITKGSPLRQRGKTAELALGYEGSINAMENMDKDKQLTKPEMAKIVRLWRNANPAIVELWDEVNNAAIMTVRTKRPHTVSCLKFEHDGTNLTILLPSGRRLFYRNPRIRPNRFGQVGIVYDGLVQSIGWTDVETYGGKLVENIVQAVARDLLSEAMVRLTQAGYAIVMHVHDECICEVPEDQADACLEQMNAIMAQNPEWTKVLPMGIPLKADGYVTKYYKKD